MKRRNFIFNSALAALGAIFLSGCNTKNNADKQTEYKDSDGKQISMYIYEPTGICASSIEIAIDENNIIHHVNIVDGCPGNTLGICKLVKNKPAEDIIKTLKGTECSRRNNGTSCPDQLARALEEVISKQKASSV